jgi:hypothetical protein
MAIVVERIIAGFEAGVGAGFGELVVAECCRFVDGVRRARAM